MSPEQTPHINDAGSAMPPRIPFVISVDVEPDDAWSNHRNLGLRNIPELLRLQKVLDVWGAKATLLLTYGVVRNDRCCDMIRRLAGEAGAEIGAHLHPWETPPFLRSRLDRRYPTFPHDLPVQCFAAKLERLTETIEQRLGPPHSYRAGRWGLSASHVPVLERLGYVVDTSVTPLFDWRSTTGVPRTAGGAGGPDYRFAPIDWYRPDCTDASRPGSATLVELPVTTAFTRPVPPVFYRLYGRLPNLAKRILRKTEALRPVRCNPAEQPDDRLRKLMAVALARPASHINMALHSSELMLGGSPSTRTESGVEAVFRRITLLVKMSAESGRCEFHTLTSAARLLTRTQVPALKNPLPSTRAVRDVAPAARPAVESPRLVEQGHRATELR